MKNIIILLSVFFALNVSSAERIEVIVSASPGGPADVITRKTIERLEKQTNLQFIVLNKPGGERVIAYNYLNNTTKPTLIFETPEIEKHEVFTQIDEIFNLGHFYSILLVSEKSRIKNLNQLIDLSKQREIIFGHASIGSYSHLASKQLCEKTLRCLGIPYKSSAEGMIGLMAGTIDAYAIVSYGSKQFVDNDKYVAIHNIRFDREKSWCKLFGKNLSEKDIQSIAYVLKSTDSRFFTEMGFDK
jgi:tripartite-type tricarboxylate transporter receptor subunit TctC